MWIKVNRMDAELWRLAVEFYSESDAVNDVREALESGSAKIFERASGRSDEELFGVNLRRQEADAMLRFVNRVAYIGEVGKHLSGQLKGQMP